MELSNEKMKSAYMTRLFWAAWWRAKRLSLETSMLDEWAILIARHILILKGSLNYSYTGSKLAEPTHKKHLLVSMQNSMEEWKFDQCETTAKICWDKWNGKQNTENHGAFELLVLFWNIIAYSRGWLFQTVLAEMTMQELSKEQTENNHLPHKKDE